MQDIINSPWLWARYVIEAIPEYLFWKDQHSYYRGCNLRFARLVGLDDPAAIVGKRDDDLPWQVHANFFRQGDRKTLAGRPVINQKETLTLKGQPPMHMVVNKYTIYDSSGKIFGILGIAQEVTLHKQLVGYPKSLHIFQSNSNQLNQHIAHHLRTPCSGIAGLTEELMQQLYNTPQKSCVDHLKQACSALLNSLNQIISLISADQQLVTQYFSPKCLLQNQLDHYRPIAEHKKISLNSHGLNQLPPKWLGDAARFEKIIGSLLSNAVTFTKQGSIDVTVSVTKKSSHDQLTIDIRDTGIGIPIKQQQRIFEPFIRLQPAHHGYGMGLGLTLARSDAEIMGGQITLDSTPGQGSCFSCVLPFQPVVMSCPPIPIKIPDPLKVLMVEDDVIVRLAQSAQLKRLNCQVDSAVDGQSALEKLRHHRYQWVLLDLGLPDISGLTVAQHIRKQYDAQSLPIIVLSAHLDNKLVKSCQAIGIQNCLVKPLTKHHAQRLIQDLKEGVLYENVYCKTHS